MKRIQKLDKERYEKANASAPVDIVPIVQPIVEVSQT